MDAQPHSRRRQYPTQQYNFNASPQAPAAPAQPQYGAADVSGVTAQMGQMNVNGYGYAAAPTDPYYGAQAAGAPGAPVPGAPVPPTAYGAVAPTPGAPAPGAGAPGQAAYGYDYAAQQGGAYGGQAGGYASSAHVSANGYGAAAAAAPALPLNELYTVDLLQSLPPPITDLALPPPPLVLPPNASVSSKPTVNATPEYMRSTLNVIPKTKAVLNKSKLPLAVVVRPYAALHDEDESVPVVSDGIVCRCRRCRTYINPFVEFLDDGNRWKCSVCNLANEVPQRFDWDPNENVRVDRWQRPELNHGVVDFVAPPEYLVRAPQPPVYVFVLDTSVNSVANGLLATAARVIADSLDRLPNQDGRTRVGFITFDNALNFFRIPLPPAADELVDGEEQSFEPSMMVVSDLEDPFLPCPEGLLVSLKECRKGIDTLLGQLGQTFASSVVSNSALGSGLKAAHKLLANIGGKIITITASLPTSGVAKLEQRDDRKLLGTPRETPLLSPAHSFYKSFAVDCNRAQVTVDMFLFGAQYQDVASLSALPRYTGGQTFLYPGWTAQRPVDVQKFAHELGNHLSMEIGLEAVLRVRASTGIRSVGYYGNSFIRSSDLMSYPTFPRDQSYVIELSLDETLNRPFVLVQSALLHTTCYGERRIRVCNMAIPTSNQVADVYASADQLAIAAYFTHKAVERAVKNGIVDAQEQLQVKMFEIFKTYKTDVLNTNAGTSGPLQLSANLRMLPLLILALKKSVGIKRSAQITPDIRVAAMNLLTTLPLQHLIKYLYADFFSLHDMPEEAGRVDENGELVLPPKLNLTGERIQSHGLYLIDDGQVQFLWVGRDAMPQLLLDAFGIDTLENVDSGKVELPVLDTDLNQRIRTLVEYPRQSPDSVYYPALYVIKENSDPALRMWATTLLVEDRTDSEPAYFQFLNSFRDKLTS